jgi:NADH:ubiquinone oxidoreductase subunit E
MDVEICVGSSCHLKGSHEVVERMKSFIAEQNLTEEIRLRGSFCLGHCTEGVSVKIDGKLVSLSPDTVEEVLSKHWEERQRAADQF